MRKSGKNRVALLNLWLSWISFLCFFYLYSLFTSVLKSFEIQHENLNHTQTMQLAVRPLTAPPEHKISLAATSGPASASQSKKSALYSIAGIHSFANNELTSQQLFALARDGFMQRGASANATSSILLQRSSTSHQSLVQLPLSQSQSQANAQSTHTAADSGAQRPNDAGAVSAAEVESSRALRVSIGTQMRTAAASGNYASEPPCGIGSGMHVALRPSYPTPFQSMLSRPATAMSQSHSALALSSRTALPRPLSALSLASRSKTERQQQQSQQHGVRAASAMASPTTRAAAVQTTTTQPPAAFRQQRSDDDEIARPHTSLGRAQTTQNAPTSNRLLAF